MEQRPSQPQPQHEKNRPLPEEGQSSPGLSEQPGLPSLHTEQPSIPLGAPPASSDEPSTLLPTQDEVAGLDSKTLAIIHEYVNGDEDYEREIIARCKTDPDYLDTWKNPVSLSSQSPDFSKIQTSPNKEEKKTE